MKPATLAQLLQGLWSELARAVCTTVNAKSSKYAIRGGSVRTNAHAVRLSMCRLLSYAMCNEWKEDQSRLD